MGFYESVMPDFAGIQFDEGTSEVMTLTAENIKKIADQLLKGKDGLHDVKFEDIPAAPTHFGRSRGGRQLGYHHDLAHKVVAGTITGVMKDLEHFSVSLTKAVSDAKGADELSAEDMERLGRAVPTTYGDQANNNSQSTVLPPGTTGGSPDTAAGDSGNDGSGPSTDNNGSPAATPGSDENGAG